MTVKVSEKPEKGRSVFLDRELARKIRVLAGALELTPSQYVASRLWPCVNQELPGVLDAMKAATQ